MPRCEQCQRDFGTEEGFLQHNKDKHGIGKISSHELKEQKKQEKEEQKHGEYSKQARNKRIRNASILVVVIIIFIVSAYILSAPPKNGAVSPRYDLAGIPSSFVHWHADVDVVVCGEDKKLSEAASGGLLGTNRLHTHDRATNIQSLPGSDGNGVIHTEGTIPQSPGEHTLDKFMKNIGIEFGNETIMDKKNGDLCNGTAGSVKAFLDDNLLDDFLNYLPRDRDVIRIEFS